MRPTKESQRPLNEWRTSCLGLIYEPALLFSSILCPWKAYKLASESFLEQDVGNVEACFGAICCFCGFDLRVRFREKYSLRGAEVEDCCIHLCCNPCALAQIAREAQHWIPTDEKNQRGPNMIRVGIEKRSGPPNMLNSPSQPPMMSVTPTSAFSHQQAQLQLQVQAHPRSPSVQPPLPSPQSRNVGHVELIPRQETVPRNDSAQINGSRDVPPPPVDPLQDMRGQVTLTGNDLSCLEDIDANAVAQNLSVDGNQTEGRGRELNREILEQFKQ